MTDRVELTFRSLGAANTVTGSKHLLEAEGTRILLDCGLFQGLKNLRELNWAPLAVDPASIDAVIALIKITRNLFITSLRFSST